MSDASTLLGIGWAFPPRFDAAGGALLVSAADDIRESLEILLQTTPGERLMQPAYGCDLRHLVFELFNQNTVTDIVDTIARAVLLFEPRIIVDRIGVDTADRYDGLIRVDLAYTIIRTNTRHNLVFPLYLDEGSNAGFTA